MTRLELLHAVTLERFPDPGEEKPSKAYHGPPKRPWVTDGLGVLKLISQPRTFNSGGPQ